MKNFESHNTPTIRITKTSLKFMQKYHLIVHYMLIKCIDIDYFGYELVFSTYSCLNINYMCNTTHRTSERHTSLVGTCVHPQGTEHRYGAVMTS